MVSTSKILTVSYGTFSCTLEGFDEPFSTMKSIAEYFRDLAADDRYFGAEPPTPDAEMLHRIAEREIQKRVEARVEDDAIVLRQADAAPSVGDATTATMIAGETLLDTAEAPEPVAPVVAPVTLVADAAPEDADLPADSIAAKLQRIRAVVDRAPEQDAPGDFVEDRETEAFFAGAGPAEAAFAEDETEAEFEAESVADDTVTEVSPDAADEAEAEPEIEPVAVEDVVEVEIEVEVEVEVAEETGAEDDLEDAAYGDEAADEPVDDDAVAAILGSMGAGDEPATEDDTAQDEPFAGEEGISALGTLLAASDDAETAADDMEDHDEEDYGGDAGDRDIALGDDIDRDEAKEAAGDEVDGDEDENVFADTEDEEADQAAPEPVAIARVVKVRRPDADRDVAVAEDMGEGDSMLTPEEEAELMAELAEVEQETEAGTAEINEDDETAHPAFEEAGFDESDVAVDRILAETNTQLASTEVSRRRSAIAHLKAAVQATRADKDAAGGPFAAEDADDRDVYRDDLARVVRPRRPDVSETHAPRRLAPLMLVSEQRIDTPAPEAGDAAASGGATIRPRRVTKGNLALDTAMDEDEEAIEAPDAGIGISFAAFADRAGAEDMADLLEAAAAYATFVEGRPSFSRPQIMKQVLQYDPEGTFSREEGLRAFGKLLRQGKIKKIKRGQFEISQNTRFRPEEERATA